MDGEKLPDNVRKKLVEIIAQTGAIGFDHYLKPRIRAGKVVRDTSCIRIFVEKKKPLKELKPFQIIPMEIGGIETDVVEIGHIEAPEKNPFVVMEKGRASRRLISKLAIDPTKKVRPLVMGVSVASIKVTAGTDGDFYEKDGEILEGSNFHVFGESVLKNVEEQVRDVLQPGPYHGGKMPDDYKGKLIWAHKLEGSPKSTCPLAGLYVGFGNALARLVGAKTRFTTIVSYEDNDIDFALATIEVPYEGKVLDQDLNGKKLAGHIFAGSDQTTVFCRIENIMKRAKVEPAFGQEPYEAEEGDVLEGWSWRLDGYHGTTTVQTKYATLMVDYGEAYILMTNVSIGSPMALPGTSGTALFLKEGRK
jgi:Txe/YoeB family toxin of Txe-Axe toxin-antitoxin module